MVSFLLKNTIVSNHVSDVDLPISTLWMSNAPDSTHELFSSVL